jgi:hypothetical protein
MPRKTLLNRDRAGATRNAEGVGQTLQAVHQHHHVGGLGRRGSAPRAHGDADIGGSQRRGVI